MFASAEDLSRILWTQELQSAIDRTGSVIVKLAAEKTEEALEMKEKLEALNVVLRDATEKVSQESEKDVFGIR